MWKSKPCLWLWLSRGRACWLAELSCNLWSGMQWWDARAVDLVRTQFSFYLRACSSPHYSQTLLWWQGRVLFPFCQTYFCHFGCSQVLGLPTQGFIFQILNLRLFSSCLQNRQRLKKRRGRGPRPSVGGPVVTPALVVVRQSSWEQPSPRWATTPGSM